MVSVSGFFLLQINLDSTMKVISRRSISVAYGEPVHPIMQFDPSDSTYLYLMTSYQVRSLVFGKIFSEHHAIDLALSREQEGTIKFAFTLMGRAKKLRALAGASKGFPGGYLWLSILRWMGVTPSRQACQAFSSLRWPGRKKSERYQN